jgi:lysophospholipase L1-like esterase
MGQGSTGYINNGGNAGGKDYYGAPSRMAALAALPSLDLIIPYGSGNDSSYTGTQVTTAVNSLWNAIKAARPATPIVVVGVEPGSPSAFTPSLMDSTNAVIKSAAASNPNVAGFIDMRPSGDNWVIGTGNAGSPARDGDQDFFISSDTVHPTRAGYANIALRMVDELRKIKV